MQFNWEDTVIRNSSIAPASGTAAVSGAVAHAVAPPDSLPATDRQRAVAIARAELIHSYLDYSSTGSKMHRKKQFLAAYNSGVLLPKLYAVIGEAGFGTVERWIKLYNESGSDYMSLIPAYNYKSVSTHKLTQTEEDLFMDLLLRPSRFSIGSAIRIVKDTLRIKNISSPSSPGTFRRYANTFKRVHLDVWTLRRLGEKALRDQLEPYISRDASLLNVGDVLIADGKTTTFNVINPWTGRPQKAVWLVHQDWKSNFICGFELMLTENTQCVASSLRSAVLTLQMFPKISYTDNGKAFKNKYFPKTNLEEDGHYYSLFGRLGITPVFAMPYNSKAKPVERTWREVVEIFEKSLPVFTGTSPVDKPAYMMRNEKYAQSEHSVNVGCWNTNSAFTINEAVRYFQGFLDFYHNQPCPHVAGKSIREVFDEGKGKTQISERMLNDLMMVNTERNYKVGRNGVEIFNAQYWSKEMYNHQRQRVQIRYSFFDLSHIKIYDEQGRYICDAYRKEEMHPMAAYLGTPEDVAQLKQQMKAARELEKDTKRKAQLIKEKHQSAAAQLLTGTYAAARIVATVAQSPAVPLSTVSSPKIINPYD